MQVGISHRGTACLCMVDVFAEHASELGPDNIGHLLYNLLHKSSETFLSSVYMKKCKQQARLQLNRARSILTLMLSSVPGASPGKMPDTKVSKVTCRTSKFACSGRKLVISSFWDRQS